MIHTNEAENGLGQIRFSLTLVETAQMPLHSSIAAAEQADLGRPGELILTGSQVLAGCLLALSAAGLLSWAVIKLWLFEL